MPDFNAKMHQNRFQLGLCLRPRWVAYSAPPDSQLDLRGLLLREGEERGRKGEGEWGKEGRGGGEEGEGRSLTPLVLLC